MITTTRALLAAGLLATACAGAANAATRIEGQVQAGGAPVTKSVVTLWAASTHQPASLARAETGPDGRFVLATEAELPAGATLYVVASGGTSHRNQAAGNNPAITFLAALGAKPPARVMVNEFTTIASVVTHTQVIRGTAIQGSPLALRIAADNVPNLVDLVGGGYGGTIQDPLNSSQTPTMANLATLGSLLAGCATQVTADACARLAAAAATPAGEVAKDTLAVTEAIARNPGHGTDRQFALLEAFYPVPKGKLLRPTPYLPYLSVAPSAWVFPLKFAGGGISGGGKLMIDSQGNIWVGNNFLVGAQNQSTLWSGNLSKLAPNGQPLSPMTSGFTGGGMVGVGFGLAIDAQDNVWVDSYSGQTIARFDPSGKPLSPPEGYNLGGRISEMQGIIVAPNGDIWAVDQGKSQIVHLPNGDPAKARIHCENTSRDPLRNPCGLFAPFHLAIDQQDRIWVSNNIGNAVVRFHVSDPGKVEKFDVGFGGSGLAIDSQGNVWTANRFSSSLRGRLRLYELMAAYALKGEKDATEVMVHGLSAQIAGYKDGGSVSVLRPDGSEAPFSPIFGKGLAGPWAVAVDGNDNVWVTNLVSNATGIVHICGVRPETCPAGMKTGDAISPPGGYVGGGMQQLVDVGIGPAGDVWVTNNWDIDAAAFGEAPEALSTRGAGQGVVVFYGMAKPVRTPMIGPPRAP